jgi:hypothetical protein
LTYYALAHGAHGPRTTCSLTPREVAR